MPLKGGEKIISLDECEDQLSRIRILNSPSLTLGWLILLMAVYYVASKLSIVACSTTCIAIRRRRSKCANKSKLASDEDTNKGDSWQNKEVSAFLGVKVLWALLEDFFGPFCVSHINMHMKEKVFFSGLRKLFSLRSNVNICFPLESKFKQFFKKS